MISVGFNELQRFLRNRSYTENEDYIRAVTANSFIKLGLRKFIQNYDIKGFVDPGLPTEICNVFILRDILSVYPSSYNTDRGSTLYEHSKWTYYVSTSYLKSGKYMDPLEINYHRALQLASFLHDIGKIEGRKKLSHRHALDGFRILNTKSPIRKYLLGLKCNISVVELAICAIACGMHYDIGRLFIYLSDEKSQLGLSPIMYTIKLLALIGHTGINLDPYILFNICRAVSYADVEAAHVACKTDNGFINTEKDTSCAKDKTKLNYLFEERFPLTREIKERLDEILGVIEKKENTRCEISHISPSSSKILDLTLEYNQINIIENPKFSRRISDNVLVQYTGMNSQELAHALYKKLRNNIVNSSKVKYPAVNKGKIIEIIVNNWYDSIKENSRIINNRTALTGRRLFHSKSMNFLYRKNLQALYKELKTIKKNLTKERIHKLVNSIFMSGDNEIELVRRLILFLEEEKVAKNRDKYVSSTLAEYDKYLHMNRVGENITFPINLRSLFICNLQYIFSNKLIPLLSLVITKECDVDIIKLPDSRYVKVT